MLQKLSLTALALLISGVAIAAGSGLYKDLDVNGDGIIDQEEAAALPALKDSWDKLDVNTDGVLDEAEFSKLEKISTAPQ